ncbi:hypothetical protein [uncultured Alistipes sp.]|uniref:hypothetical protein n=1 Tax=uncultured Alistipes sp. TaxID=538949 RepID=UPI002674D40E|nr:hypothetical protein [uncultured Alistipes sp.]
MENRLNRRAFSTNNHSLLIQRNYENRRTEKRIHPPRGGDGKRTRNADAGGGGDDERSCIILVNEKLEDSDTTAQCIAIMGSGKGLIKSMASFLERPDMAEVASLGAKLAALKKIVEN